MFSSLIKFLIFTFFLSLISCGTAPLKPYAFNGTNNLKIKFETDDTIFSSNNLFIDWYEDFANCKYRYLGRVTVPESKESFIAIPVGKPISFKTTTEKNGFLGSSTNYFYNGVFNFQATPNQQFEIELYRRDGLRAETVYKVVKGQRLEIDSAPETCKEYIDIDAPKSN